MSTHVCLACLLYKELYPFAPLDSSPKDLLKLTLKGWDCFFLRLSIAQRRHTWFFYSYLFFILCGSQRLLRILHLLAKDYHYRDYSASIQFLEHWSRPMSRFVFAFYFLIKILFSVALSSPAPSPSDRSRTEERTVGFLIPNRQNAFPIFFNFAMPRVNLV